ncbi:MAG TPA: TonB-dependent receptor [Nitrospiraceae bacterium]|nr:TonB-dependent receptor [Nitrospiraceae bacterium]
MRSATFIGGLVLAVLAAIPVWADDNAIEKRMQKLEEEVREYREALRKSHEQREGTTEQPRNEPSVQEEPGIGSLPDVARERRTEQQPALSFGSTGSGRLVYAKPFVSSPKAIVGGYMDFSFRSQKKGTIDTGYAAINNNQGVSNVFDQQRFVPFIYADVTEHLKMSAELEIEHGIREEGGPDRELEFGLEFAQVDYLIKESFNLRGGILLVPIGKFNLLHDSPLNDLTDRPLVSQLVIPTTMAETGAGFYGTFYPGRTGKVDYELYVTTGPCGYEPDGTPTVNQADGTRGARQRKCASDDGLDINNGKAVAGRLAFSPTLGIEIAGSGYYGNASPSSYNPMSIAALDWTFQRGPFELIGEAAWAYNRGNSRAIPGNTIGFAPGSLLTGIPGNSAPGTPPQRSNGFYIQGNYHFLPQWLANLSPKHFGPGSTFTAVFRYDRVNTDLDTQNGFGNIEQLSFGLNYRPIEDAAFKLSYQYQPKAFDPISQTMIHNSVLVMSVATYF